MDSSSRNRPLLDVFLAVWQLINERGSVLLSLLMLEAQNCFLLICTNKCTCNVVVLFNLNLFAKKKKSECMFVDYM